MLINHILRETSLKRYLSHQSGLNDLQNSSFELQIHRFEYI